MTDNNSQIIDYEEIFQEDNNKKLPERKENESRSFTTILIYLFLFILGFGSLFVQTIIKNSSPKKSDTYLLISKVDDYYSDNLIVFVPKDEYDNEILHFDNEKIQEIAVSYQSLNDYVLVTKTTNTVTLNWLNDPLNIERILSGETNKWLSKINNDKEEYASIYVNYLRDTSFSKYLDEAAITSFSLVERFTNTELNYLMFFVYLIVFIPLLLMHLRPIKIDFLYLEQEYHPVLGKILSSFAYMLIANYVLNIVTGLLQSLLNTSTVSANQESILTQLYSNGGFLVAISVVIFAPLVEELVFRKSIFGLIKNDKTAIIASALLFGLIHLTTEIMALFTGADLFNNFANLIVTGIPYIG
ncbi:MAG: type II CAAX endopeptidase family protein, partial [Acholeplasma sp.]|nr:type II CAAX endopeptidase family protein [Acholeplasma sp.]